MYRAIPVTVATLIVGVLLGACGSTSGGPTTATRSTTTGGSTSTIATSPPTMTLSGWAAFSADGLTVSRLDGTQRHVVTSGQPGEQIHPDWSPDGSKLVYTRHPDEALWVMDVDGSNPRELVPYVAGCCGVDHAYWSPDGTTIAFTHWVGDSEPPSATRLELIDADGTNRRVLATTKAPLLLDQAHWSPNGKMIAVEVNTIAAGGEIKGSAIGIVSVASGALTMVTSDAGFYSYPDWSPDGKRLVFDANGNSLWENLPTGRATNLFTSNIDGTDLRQITHLPVNGHRATEADWVASGVIAYVEEEATRSPSRFLRFVSPTGEQLPDPATPIHATHPRIHLDRAG
jgi:Tol biopolymer transport system component